MEQLLMNEISILGNDDDELWNWLIAETSALLAGKKVEAKISMHENSPFQSSMFVKKMDNRIHVNMESFGCAVCFSWEINIEKNGRHSFVDFKMESSLEGDIANA